MLKALTPIVGTCAVAMILAGCGGSSSDAKKSSSGVGTSGHQVTLKAGAMMDLTGPYAPLGAEQKDALNALLAQVNASGKVHLDITVKDSESQTSTAVELAHQFVQQGDKVIFGPTSTGACLAVQQVVEQADTVEYCYAGGITKLSPHTFAGEYDPIGELGAKPLSFFKSKGWATVALLQTADASGQAYSEALKMKVPNSGVQLVDDETFQPGATDVVAQLTKIRAKNPDVLYAGVSGANLTPIVRGVVQLGWNVPVFAGFGAVSYQTLDAVKDFIPSGGLYSSGNYLLVPNNIPDNYPGKNITESFVSKYEAATGSKPGPEAGDFADSLRIVEAAASAAVATGQPLNGTSIAMQIEKLHNFPGITSTFTFGPNTHRGTTPQPVILRWNRNGEFSFESSPS